MMLTRLVLYSYCTKLIMRTALKTLGTVLDVALHVLYIAARMHVQGWCLILWFMISPPPPLQISGFTLPYDELPGVRKRLAEVAPHMVRYDDLQPANFFALAGKLLKVSAYYAVY